MTRAPASVAAAGVALAQAGSGFAASPEGRSAGPAGPLDWVLLALAVVAVAIVFALCARFFLSPGEHSEDHIKRRVLRERVERE